MFLRKELGVKIFKVSVILILVSIVSFSISCQAFVPPEETGEEEEAAKFFPAEKPSAVKGKAIYDSNCQRCHGATGGGDGPAASALTEKPPSFTDLNFMRREEPEHFFQIITDGARPMPSFKKKLTASERWDSVFYAWSFATTPQKIAAGKQLYDADCATCHGKKGDGKGPRAKDLKTKPSDFTETEHMMAETSKSMFDVITKGEKPMPSFKDKLSEEDRWNVIDYIWTFTYKPPS